VSDDTPDQARQAWETARDELRKVTAGMPLRDTDRDRLVAAQAMYHATLTAWLLDLRQSASPDR
jgi:hypothetical protein